MPFKRPRPRLPGANITDPDSRVMSTKHGWVQGYNAQAIVNPKQIVLACEVSHNGGGRSAVLSRSATSSPSR